ncbi:hypothetical protein [Lactobacillus crispatus]|uniref:hypothetical protein n=1 Tax=Lactobacillus crispatus TaxID=47770 RepID=UPI0018AC87B0|nr:hypothetical protein [Lactobacillus crispatus]
MNDLEFFAIGIFIGVIIFILVVTFGSQKKYEHKYDERQKLVRGQGAKWGFIVLVFSEIIVTFFMKNPFFMRYGITINFSIIMLSLAVMSVYDILHGAYFAINEKNIKSNSWLDIVMGICFILGYVNDFNSAMTIMGIYWLIIGAVSLFQLHRDKESDKE